MGKDWPDWGATYNNAAFFPLSDDAELAARLGSIVTHDRRGSLIWAYDFRYGLDTIEVVKDEADSSVDLVTNPVEIPPFCAYANPLDGSDDIVGIKRSISIPNCELVGFSCSFYVPQSTYLITLTFTVQTATYAYFGRVIIISDYNRLYLDCLDGEIILNNDLPDLSSEITFLHLKVVFNLTTKKAERIIFADSEHDVSDYSLYSGAGSGQPRIECQLTVSNLARDPSDKMYVDSLIFTANEPANA